MSRKSTMRLTLLIILLTATPTGVALSQNQPAGEAPTGCELNTLYIDDALSRIKSGTSPELPVIAIARLGDGETSTAWNKRRLTNLKLYVTEFRKTDANLVLAEGEKTKGPGRIELYVGGQLFRVLLVGRGKDLPVGTCTEDRRNCIFFPWRVNSRAGPCWPG